MYMYISAGFKLRNFNTFSRDKATKSFNSIFEFTLTIEFIGNFSITEPKPLKFFRILKLEKF